jgi:polyhydroxyalkanoate synthesis regulator phasin
MGDGIRQGIGVLSAFKDALEETIQEARDRGDLSADRAKQVMKEALDRAQEAAEGAKERLDFASQADLESVRGTVEALQDRLADLETSVFGAPRARETPAAAGPEASKGEGKGDSAATDAEPRPES